MGTTPLQTADAHEYMGVVQDQPCAECVWVMLAFEAAGHWMNPDAPEDEWADSIRLMEGTENEQAFKSLLTGELLQRIPDETTDLWPDAAAALKEACRAQDAEVLIRALRLLRGRVIRPAHTEKPSLGTRMINYVEAHLGDPRLSIKWMAENVFFMNVDYMGRQFTRAAGEKFTAYISRRRMEEAQRLLGQKRQTVASVARRMGFEDNPQYFARLFKLYTGQTPREFLRKSSGAPQGRIPT